MTEKSILITGGAGFIGSNFIINFLNKYSDYKVINLDLLTYAADLNNLKEVESNPNYTFIKGDICDRPLIEDIFNKYHINGVIHFAAESHVDNSITGPDAFIRTNINGTFTLLDVARKYWMSAPFEIKPGHEQSRFHHISTDEVYGTLGETGYFTEETPYAPNSPYSASKASSDMIVRSYFHTYGMNVVTTNCSNNYGPRQHGEKLIPTIIRKALAEEPIPIYGDGKNVRDWLYVDDHCSAIDLVFHKGRSGETYNIGGDAEKTNLEVVGEICARLDQLKPRESGMKYEELVTFVKDRAGHDKRYAIDATKIKSHLEWSFQHSFNKGITLSIDWYLD
ncbi:dTDP-glucose 4,6-dehydratase [Halobacteriovorax sp. JY17]|uniref:dTDP-glucose 4,6-dehydratase n=1 Tax=Halobacteriovorax sp. JY17 TaxID=2014617 RepID=UPI000C5ACED4|nr:dTDP-glucose 4,6-dehydratase [Halobacteriovorax sp. JY17]PIK14712.1 MAG: dTDP-glucose 4,6-dehydratase [Halobacteriovorax sp. JY17]